MLVLSGGRVATSSRAACRGSCVFPVSIAQVSIFSLESY